MYIKYVLKLENQGQLHNHLRVLSYRYGCLASTQPKPSPNAIIMAANDIKQKQCIELHMMPEFRRFQESINKICLEVANREIDNMDGVHYD